TPLSPRFFRYELGKLQKRRELGGREYGKYGKMQPTADSLQSLAEEERGTGTQGSGFAESALGRRVTSQERGSSVRAMRQALSGGKSFAGWPVGGREGEEKTERRGKAVREAGEGGSCRGTRAEWCRSVTTHDTTVFTKCQSVF